MTEATPLTKPQLVSLIAAKAESTEAQAERCYEAVMDTIKELLIDGRPVRTPIGTLKITITKPTTRMNVATREPVAVPAKKKVSFRVGSVLKKQVESQPVS